MVGFLGMPVIHCSHAVAAPAFSLTWLKVSGWVSVQPWKPLPNLDIDLEIRGLFNFLPVVSTVNILPSSRKRGNFSNSFVAVRPHYLLSHAQSQVLLPLTIFQIHHSKCRFWSFRLPFLSSSPFLLCYYMHKFLGNIIFLVVLFLLSCHEKGLIHQV